MKSNLFAFIGFALVVMVGYAIIGLRAEPVAGLELDYRFCHRHC